MTDPPKHRLDYELKDPRRVRVASLLRWMGWILIVGLFVYVATAGAWVFRNW